MLLRTVDTYGITYSKCSKCDKFQMKSKNRVCTRIQKETKKEYSIYMHNVVGMGPSSIGLILRA